MAVSPLDPRQRALFGAMRGLPQNMTGLPQAPTLADLFTPSAPTPVQVSPASPAPVKPGVEITPQRPVLSVKPPVAKLAEERDIDPRNMPMGSPLSPPGAGVAGPPPADAAPPAEAEGDFAQRSQVAQTAAREESLRRIADAEANAKLDPEEEALLARQAERNEGKRALLDRDEKRSQWDSLTQMGLAMMKSESPYFTQALAAGLEAGTKGLDKARLDKREQAAAIDERADQIAQTKITAMKQAKADAIARLTAGETLTSTQLSNAKLTDEQIARRATGDSTIRQAKDEGRQKAAEANKAEVQAKNEQRKINSDIDLQGAQADYYRTAGDRAALSGRGRGGASTVDARNLAKVGAQDIAARGEANRAQVLWQQARVAQQNGARPGNPGYVDPGKTYAALLAARAKALGIANQRRQLEGQPPLTMDQLFPPLNARVAALKAAQAGAPPAPVAPPAGGKPPDPLGIL